MRETTLRASYNSISENNYYEFVIFLLSNNDQNDLQESQKCDILLLKIIKI